jgi:ankyrin repeat protein
LDSHNGDANKSTLVTASRLGHHEIVRMLLSESIKVGDLDAFGAGDLALARAAANGHKKIVSLLLRHGVNTELADDSTGQTPLGTACGHGHFSIARLLLEAGAMINGGGGDENTPLLDAIESGHSDIAGWLIEEGADIHRACSGGKTALWSACSRGNFTIAQILVKRGADVNIQVSTDDWANEWTVMSVLSRARKDNHFAIAQLLFENGAS